MLDGIRVAMSAQRGSEVARRSTGPDVKADLQSVFPKKLNEKARLHHQPLR